MSYIAVLAGPLRPFANGPAKAERKRMDSLGSKLDRVIGVLTMRIEGHTQEDIAQVLDLSRNQVKYIAELVQEAYEQFSAMCTRSLQRSPQPTLDEARYERLRAAARDARDEFLLAQRAIAPNADASAHYGHFGVL
jgi:hypothetical protein